ncbi:MAG: M14 family zinc carboxypeptidase [candidate division WOR-3 bacterium]
MNRKSVLLALLVTGILVPVFAAGYLDIVEMKVKVYARPDQLPSLADEVLEFYEVTPEWFVGAVTEPFYKELLSLGYEVEVIVPDVRARALELDAFFHTYEQLRDTWIVIAQNHPGICVLDTIGISAGGRLLLAMKVSDNPTVMEGEPRICFDFSIHGNENNGCEIAHWALIRLVADYGTDPLITYLVNNREIWLCPMDNPDGLVSRSRYNAHGVDCNRNYGYSWDAGGPSVFSEPEANCFYHLAEENPMAMWTQYHSGTTASMWCWGYTTKATMDSVLNAWEMQRYGSICNYPAYQIARGLYSVHGGSTDWYYGARGALGFGHEVCNGQPSPVGEIDTICRKNWTAMKEQIQRVNRGVMGYVTDSISGQPLYALIVTNPPDWFTYSDSIGYFHKYLGAGTYTVTAVANGYRSKTIMGVVVPTDSFTVVNIALAPDTAEPVCAFKVIANKIRENPANTNPTNAWWALGRADDRRFSLGNGGWATYDMGKRSPIINGPGADFYVIEGDADVEGCSVYVSNDWNSNWRYLGFGMGTQGYDLSVAGLSTARFVRIADDNVGPTGPYAGFDLDAIEAVVVNAPALVYQGQTVLDSPPGGNNDGKLDPGESAGFLVTLKNAGRVGLANVTAVLSTADQYVTVVDSVGSYGNIEPDSVRINTGDRFAVVADINTPREHVAQMMMYVSGADYQDSIRFTITVGELRAIDPIPDGPRQPPLYWAYDDVDSGYAQHPQYDWVEIRGLGTRLTLSDDQTVVVSLPTGFGPWRYYGSTFTQVSICGNGWISPGSTTNSGYNNVALPDGTSPAQLALFWDDLYPPAGGGVWYYHDADNHRFIVEFDSVCKYSPRTSFIKGQFVIYDTIVSTPTGDNVVVIQYHSCNDWTSSTVGIEDPTCTIGITCLNENSYNRGCAALTSGRAVKYTTVDPTGIAEPEVGAGNIARLAIISVTNPVRDISWLSYSVPRAANVSLGVFDQAGRLVRQLARGQHQAGRYDAVWDGNDDSGQRLAAGVYWLRLSDESGSTVAKAVLLH